jgi:pimeloyl-ACP methyl ester carboxylesterase
MPVMVPPTPARSGTTALGPFTMRWEEHGPTSGPLILLLHGIYAGASSYEWRELVPLLARTHRVRVPDLLGAGASDRPDLEWSPEVLTSVVDALVVDAAAGNDEAPLVVASSLTGAHAVRALGDGVAFARLVLITPTGLGSAQSSTSGAAGRIAYGIGRHTPVGDLFVRALSSAPSVRWFQTHQTYADPEVLTDEEVIETRRVARLPNAKHLQLAFVANRLGLELSAEEVRAVEPLVLWGSAQGFVDQEDPQRWRDAGAEVVELASGLPQVEEPERVAELILV